MPQPTEETDELQARNLVLTGTSVVAGEGRAVVYATGAHTQFGRIAKLTQGDNRERSPLLAEIARVSRIIGVHGDRGGCRAGRHRHEGRPAALVGVRVRHRHHRGECAGRPAADGDPGARHGGAAHGEAERADPPPAGGGNAGLVHRHLHRQDRHADAQPHGGEGDVRAARSACRRGAPLPHAEALRRWLARRPHGSGAGRARRAGAGLSAGRRGAVRHRAQAPLHPAHDT